MTKRGRIAASRAPLLALAITCLAAAEMFGAATIDWVKFRISSKSGSSPVSSAAVTGGVEVTGIVSVSGLSRLSTLSVGLSSSDTKAATVPSSVLVTADAKGGGYKEFTITTKTVSASRTVTITAGRGSGVRTALLTLDPLTLSSLSLSPMSVTRGLKVTGTVTLNVNAPSATSIEIRSSGQVSHPRSVSIPQGQKATTFEITTRSDALFPNEDIVAIHGSVRKTATFTIKPPVVVSVDLNPDLGDPPAVVGGAGNRIIGTVTLDGPTPPPSSSTTDVSALSLPLSTNNPAYGRVEQSVQFTAGERRSRPFYFTPSYVQQETLMRITIGEGSGARQVNLKIMPVGVRELDLEEGRRSTKVAGGTTFNARFRLNGPAPAGFVVALSSSDPSVVVPSTVAVLFGVNESPNFEVSTMNVLETKNVTITGTPSAGAEPGLVQVGPRRISQFTLDSSTSLGALGGSPVTGTITLDSPVQGSAFVVPLSSSSPAATVPASITIPVGSTGGVGAGDFTINTTTVDADVPVTITAGEGETAMFAQLTVRALAVDQIRVSQDNVPGGSQVGASVTLNFAAPAGGFTVPLSSSDPQVASVPSSVTVLQGHMDASFNVSTSEVTADASVTITAGQGATAKTDNFTVENK